VRTKDRRVGSGCGRSPLSRMSPMSRSRRDISWAVHSNSSMAIHFGWDFTQGILGLPVASVIFPARLLTLSQTVQGPLAGTITFGPDAGLLVTAAFLVACCRFPSICAADTVDWAGGTGPPPASRPRATPWRPSPAAAEDSRPPPGPTAFVPSARAAGGPSGQRLP